MANSKKSSGKWEATHRYGDVFECKKGDVQLSHSTKGLKKAAEDLEADGGDFAVKQLEIVNAKLEAIETLDDEIPARIQAESDVNWEGTPEAS